ncbi:MAG: recombinase family protein [Colwellia sp.]|jgi:Resolvase, N terminal domain.
MHKFVTYYRVSTKGQGDSGLGLEAQKRDIQIYLDNYASNSFEIVGTFTDVDSGASDGREELSRAIVLGAIVKSGV